MKKEEQEFYLVEEVAEKLRVSKMTIYRYIDAGRLKAHKLGKEFRISKEDFDNFLKKTKV
ncbi:MAG: helix-turn-helix domain-containing protein [Candidatus Magasanikbacteria bacterium]